MGLNSLQSRITKYFYPLQFNAKKLNTDELSNRFHETLVRNLTDYQKSATETVMIFILNKGTYINAMERSIATKAPYFNDDDLLECIERTKVVSMKEVRNKVENEFVFRSENLLFVCCSLWANWNKSTGISQQAFKREWRMILM